MNGPKLTDIRSSMWHVETSRSHVMSALSSLKSSTCHLIKCTSIIELESNIFSYTELLAHSQLLILARLDVCVRWKRAPWRPAESLLTRFAVCPHTNCCVKSRWRLIRITPVGMSALRRPGCTGKHRPAVALALAINANRH